MSPPQPAPLASSPVEPSDQEALVRLLREELIKTQLIVLDLNDRILEKETEKADVVALLGKVESVLEQKLNVIGELQTTHANESSQLREQLKISEDSVRAKELVLSDTTRALHEANDEINKLRAQFADQANTLALNQTALNDARIQIEQLTSRLSRTEQSLTTAQSQLATIRRSALWKLGAPWRAVFGPKP